MLVLFDIDGTMLLTRHAGLRSMVGAASELFGSDFSLEGLDVAGRLDPLIFHDLAMLNGISDPAAHHDRFRETYARHLADCLAQENTVRLLPGVADLLDALDAETHVTLGLLTGNYPETGALKITYAGLDASRFAVAAWGCDAATRRDLPAVAIDRLERSSGTRLPGDRVVVIGDTPSDVECAQAHGCRSLAVATGGFDIDVLNACDADLVVENLIDTEAILRWMMSG